MDNYTGADLSPVEQWPDTGDAAPKEKQDTRRVPYRAEEAMGPGRTAEPHYTPWRTATHGSRDADAG